MSSDHVAVATSGKTVPRDDECHQCGEPLVYRMEGEEVAASFCRNAKCSMWLTEIAE